MTGPEGVLCGPYETTVHLGRDRVRAFAEAIGDEDPLHTDLAAARAAGHPDLVVPPTMLAGLELETRHVHAVFDALGVDIRVALHAEQTFEYLDLVHANETVTMRTTVGEEWEKREGALRFLPRDTEVRCRDQPVVRMRATVVLELGREGVAS